MRRIFRKVTARMRKNSFYSLILEKTGRDLSNKKWIFILGCYNSGTTLLNEILAAHPSISGLPDEGVMLTNQLVKPEDFSWRRMWWKCENEMEASNINMNKNAKKIKKHWSHFFADSEYLVEKSISNVCRIPFFEKEFRPAYFIHIVRNGYAVAEGIRRKAQIMPDNEFYGQENYPMELCINQWVKTLEKVYLERERVSHFLEISYEELTENPQATMGKITDFLNLPPYEADFFSKSFSIHEKSSEIRNMNDNSLKKLSSNDISIINKIAADHLTKKGYDIL